MNVASRKVLTTAESFLDLIRRKFALSRAAILKLGKLQEVEMTRYAMAPIADPADFDEDVYVIDEPSDLLAEVHPDPEVLATAYDRLLQLALAVPSPQIYWTVPLDIDWADED
jgi:hypothetical protein